MNLTRYTFIMDGKEVYTCYCQQEAASMADTLSKHRLDHELKTFDFNTRKTETQKLKF